MSSLNLVRKLTVVLIASGALNIALLAGFFYWSAKDRIPMPYYELRPADKHEQQVPLAIDHSNSDVIRCFRKMPLEQLIGRLRNVQLVENGYSQRDLALACLVCFHHFDLERALLGYAQPDQKRTIAYGRFRSGEPAELTVYPSLTEKQYEAIINFAATERWPLDSQGLFSALRKQQGTQTDPSLCDAFFLTQEFLAVDTLFSRAEVPVDKRELLSMLLEGDWTMLSIFAEQQRGSQDLSSARRQRFLLDYIIRNSKSAALLVLKTDGELAVRKLDDNHVVMILQLLDEKTPEAEKFALSLLTSPRSNTVWKEAAARLYAYAGEPMPEKYQHHAAISRFLPGHAVIVAANEPAPHAADKNIVQPSEPLRNPSPGKPGTPPKKVAAPVKPPEVKQPSVRSTLPRANIPHGSIPRGNLPPPNREVRRERLYVVQQGDSLWKISRRFDVDVDRIKAYNKLDSDFLKPGRPLLIP